MADKKENPTYYGRPVPDVKGYGGEHGFPRGAKTYNQKLRDKAGMGKDSKANPSANSNNLVTVMIVLGVIAVLLVAWILYLNHENIQKWIGGITTEKVVTNSTTTVVTTNETFETNESEVAVQAENEEQTENVPMEKELTPGELDFNARELYKAKDWDGLCDISDKLRKAKPEDEWYRSIAYYCDSRAKNDSDPLDSPDSDSR